MSIFEDIYRKLFANTGQSPRILHEVITRSAAYKRDYERWKNNGNMEEQMAKLYNSYQMKARKIEVGYKVHLLDSNYANGFALTYEEDFSRIEFQYLFDYLAERTLPLGYTLVNSDITITEKPNFIESKEKHYLKPALNQAEAPLDQLFGNILIEQILVNDRPSYIKLVANVYADSLYKAPRPFTDYMELLFAID